MKISMSVYSYNYAVLFVFQLCLCTKIHKTKKIPKRHFKKKRADKSIYLKYKDGFMIFKPLFFKSIIKDLVRLHQF